jgi:hypothetical protein
LLEIEAQLRTEVGELFALGERADQGELHLQEGLDIANEIAIRQERLANLAKAKAVLEERARERHAVEQAEYEAKVREREEKARKKAKPTLEALSPQLGQPQAGALDNGYWSEPNLEAFETRGIEPYIATGREAHHKSWRTFFAEDPLPPSEDANPVVKMAYKLQTEIGKAIYRLRKCTVEPVIGIIKEVMGFRQFSLRGLAAAAGEWCLVCLAFNLKRLHVLMIG